MEIVELEIVVSRYQQDDDGADLSLTVHSRNIYGLVEESRSLPALPRPALAFSTITNAFYAIARIYRLISNNTDATTVKVFYLIRYNLDYANAILTGCRSRFVRLDFFLGTVKCALIRLR